MIETHEERIVESEMEQEEEVIERTLRPTRLREFIGQEEIKESLEIALLASQKRGEPIEHVLLYGNPGLGKTTLAHIISKEMGGGLTMTAGPALLRVGDLAAILTNLKKGDILFIDEIHRMPSAIEEVLYSAMEDTALDIMVGKGPGARTLRMSLEPFTLIGATTKLNLLSNPLRDRFGHIFHLNFYTPEEIAQIIEHNAEKLGTTIEPAALLPIAARSRRTPRVANRLLRRIRDYAEVKKDGHISEAVVDEALSLLRVDRHGLDDVDRKILATIIKTFQGGPVGLGTLAAAVAEEVETIESVYEPYLLQIGMLERTARGRKITEMARSHMEGAGEKKASLL